MPPQSMEDKLTEQHAEQTMTLLAAQVFSYTAQQKNDFSESFGLSFLVLRPMAANLQSAAVQAIGLRLCESLAKAELDQYNDRRKFSVARNVAKQGVAAYAVRAAIQHSDSSFVVESARALLLSAIASFTSTEGAADGMWEALSTVSDVEAFVANWRLLGSDFSAVLVGEALRAKLDTFGTASELKTFSFTKSEWLAANYSLLELKAGKFTASEVKAAGFTLSELKHCQN